MSTYCLSCTAPLSNPEFKGASDTYCKYCSDAKGKLKSRDEVKQGIVEWFKTWHPAASVKTLSARAEHFMKAMPAWAEKK